MRITPTDVKWIKIVVDIFDDEKILLIEALPEADSIIVIWFKLLCLAGKVNNGGILTLNDRIAYTDEMLSQIFRRPVNTIRLALTTFERFGMIEIVNDTIFIPNWEKHQSVERMAEMKEYNKIKQRESRARRKALLSNGENTNSDSNDASMTVNDMSMTCQRSSISISNISSSLSKENIEDKNRGCRGKEKKEDRVGEMFSIFYEAYGNKKSPNTAEKAFRKINPSEEVFQQIMSGIERYHQSRKWREGYRKEPATWLNGGCWKDEYDSDSVAQKPQKQVTAQQYGQRQYTEQELLSVSDDLLEAARKARNENDG